ncbi:cbb3-type cytochrome c oxidase subunit I [Iamia sp.]|uniref:cbb3-type cytochrome c oxidase subunit I n=1 Tax=Iamia sp. TaxID=2722710 RepID=UPI002BBC2EAB|nr:cbb3-type cytochrome c oxidase subunit I [Iamia sp.]HXH56664.1 cbb3-type cytochrome c oxidase subunit I [Iamia sp.]
MGDVADEVHASMTATQAPPRPTAPDAPVRTAAPVGGLAGILGSADHKVVGRLYVGTALLMALASGVAGLLAGIDRIDGVAGNTILNESTADQVVTFHATSATLLVLIPALLGLAMVVVPLQVGARTIAFPRAAAASYWTFLVGAGMTVTAYAINGGPGGGRSDAVDLWLAATALVAVALVLGSVCVATTVLAVRTKGMGLDRVPFFSWSMLCTSVLWLLTLPVLVAVLIVMYVDHRYGQVFIGDGGPAMYEQVAWFGRQPQVYAVAIPVLGLVLDAATTASGVRLVQRGAARVAIGAFAVLGVGAFALEAISSPEAADQPVTKAMALLAPLPVLAVVGLAAGMLRQRFPKVTSGLVGGIIATLVLLLATLVGAATAFEGALELAGTQWVTAQAHLTLVAAAIGLVAGLYHWSTKVVGRVAGEGPGRTAPLVIALGAVVLAGPEALSGLLGDGDEAATGIEALNAAAVAGAVLVLLGGLVATSGLVGRRRADEPADPWDGHTLEWATASPPSFSNFDGDVPAVTSAEPLRVDADAEEVSA